MKKAFVWIGLTLLSPVLLFLLLTVLLYVPPVQNWAVDKVAKMASESTGLHIAVEHVCLKFPLDLQADGVLVVRPERDTIASIERTVVDVQLLPLLKQQVVVNELQLSEATVNTLDLISDLQVSGHVGLLSVSSHGIDLGQGTAQLNGALLSDADLLVQLSDTAAADTTSSEVPWNILVDSLAVWRSRIDVRMPGDSMRITATLGHAQAADAEIDLLNEVYTVRSFFWHDGSATYDLPYEPAMKEGIDYNHIALSQVNLTLDSIYYHSPNLSLKIAEAAMKEQSGLQLSQLSSTVIMDSVGIRLPNLQLATPYSNIRARVGTDFHVMDSIQPGQLHLDMNAAIGKQDIMFFMADVPSSLRKQWPEWPLNISGKIDGNMQKASIERLEVSLPTVFHATVDGQVCAEALLAAPTSTLSSPTTQLSIQAETYRADIFNAFMPSANYRIPDGMTLSGQLKANGSRYTADVIARQGKGSAVLKGWFDQQRESYDARMDISNLNLHAFLPKDSLYTLSAHIDANGQGTDFLKQGTRMEAHASITHLQYGSMALDSIVATAVLHDNKLQADLSSCNQLLEGMVSMNAQLSKKQVEGNANVDLQKVDLYRMGISEAPLAVGGTGQIQLFSDMNQEHWLRATLSELYIKDEKDTYHPEPFGMYAHARADSTWLRAQSGDLIVKFDGSGDYEKLLSQFTTLADTMMAQYENRIIDQTAIKRLLPTTRLYVTSGNKNPVADILRVSSNIHFKDLALNLNTSASTGINGTGHLFSLNADSTRIDTVTVTLKDTDRGLTFQSVVANNRRNPQFVFRALIDGHIFERGARAGVRYYDEQGELGLRLGATAAMEQDGINFHLMPSRPTIGYKEFNLNDDNFILLHNNLRLEAKVNLIADDGTGVKVYSEDQDSTMLQDLTVSLYKFDMDKLTSVMPYMPRISGILNGDYHLMMNQEKQISVASDMSIDNLSYEQSPIGNLSTEFVYLQREDDTHAVEGRLLLEEKEVGMLKGEYLNKGNGHLNADLVLTHFPMMIVNGFVPDKLLGLEGYAEGEVKVVGSLKTPQVDGEIYLEQAALVSVPYGVRLRFDDDPVRVINSQLLLENFTMYAYNDQPLNIMGNIDFHNTDRVTMDMRMRARNFQLINTKQTKESIAYGKAFVNFFATLQGRMDQLKMRGRLDVLGTTDLTYLLLDSPLSTDNQLDELVKFTDFADSTQTVVSKPTPQGIDVDMTISIDQGAHVKCGLNVDQTNYIDLFGGGDLRMKYSNDGIAMTGRYTLTSGEMKYSLPVIPLKTFSIQDGSYVEFTGEPMNPRLNITATERTKASVSQEGQQSRSVAFDCGVVITKTLSDMGLEFIISAPEDGSISNELNAMSKEQRGKLAVTMLTTGMYLADGNTSGFSMNSALSSFLQNEINNITGNALKTLDLSIGLDNTTDATGSMHTDYSFKFAKRFWNNRLKVQIGGKVSTGSEVQGQKQSFFDNVTMEYRLTPTSNQYVKLFYNQNVYDWLEGYTSEYGGGYIWKRKLDKFWDLFGGSSSLNSKYKIDNVNYKTTDSSGKHRADSVPTTR